MLEEDRGANAVERTSQKAEIKKAESLAMATLPMFKTHSRLKRERTFDSCGSELRSCVKGGRPGLPVPNSPCGLRGRKATLNLNWIVSRAV